MSKTETKNLKLAVKYSLTWLDHNLRDCGVHKKCFNYNISGDRTMLRIVYLDYLCRQQYIFVFRTSRLCYRICYGNTMINANSAGIATNKILDLLDTIIAKAKVYDSITVREHNKLNPELDFYVNGDLDFNKRMELSRRDNKDYNKKRLDSLPRYISHVSKIDDYNKSIDRETGQ